MQKHNRSALLIQLVAVLLISKVCFGAEADGNMTDSVSDNTAGARPSNDAMDMTASFIAYGEYVEGRKFKRIGMVNTLLGGAAFIPGTITTIKYAYDSSFDMENEAMGAVGITLLISSAVSLAVGIPLLISGSRKKRKYRELINTPVLQLSFNRGRSHGLAAMTASAAFTF